MLTTSGLVASPNLALLRLVPAPERAVQTRRVNGAKPASCPDEIRAEADSTLEANPAYARGLDLLRGAIDGDPATRNEFVEQYTGLIRFAIAGVLRQRGLVVQKEEIDDLTHSVILSLFERDCRKLRMYEGRNRASLATFIRVCTTRFVLDHIRHLRRRPQLELSTDSNDELALAERADPGPGPEASAAAAENVEQLRRAVCELPTRERLFVRLHFVEGLDIGDAARVLGLTENATYVLKSRVKKKLRSVVTIGEDERD